MTIKPAFKTFDPEVLSEYLVHPLADALPRLAESELEALAHSIKTNGQKVPVIIVGGVVVDGRNRIEACVKAGVSVRALVYDQLPYRQVCDIIASRNIDRRQLTPRQRARAAAAYRQHVDPTTSWEAAADRFGVSRRTIYSVRAEFESEEPDQPEPQAPRQRWKPPEQLANAIANLKKLYRGADGEQRRQLDELVVKLEKALSKIAEARLTSGS